MRAALAIALALAFASPARADEESELGRRAVQNREYSPRHELDLTIGVLPLDAFYKGFMLGFGYTYHFNDNLAWEVIQANYILPVNTDLKNELELNFAAAEKDFQQLDILASSNFVLKPLYGKFSALNRRVAHLELMLNVGGGLGISLPRPDPADSSMEVPLRITVGPDVGIGIRLWVLRFFSLRVDVRDYVLLGGPAVDNQLSITFSFALSSSRSPQ